MAEVLLISPLEITRGTPLGGNVDTDKYIYLVKDAQIMHIEPILGTKLYEKLKTDFAANTLTGVYLQLVDDYIKPILVHMSCAEFVSIAPYRVQNGGMYKHLPSDAESMSLDEIHSLTKNQKAKADVYIDRLNRFLCDQNSNIPEYTSAQDNDYDEKPNPSDNYFGGLFLGRKRYDNWKTDEIN
jgi:hypothetical protein